MKNEISLITPVSKDLLYTKIADAITAYIRTNNMKYGDKLPSERELAARFKTSRHSVREALRVLQHQGIIDSQMGSGTYVAHIGETSSIYLQFVKINFLEMLSIKTELEKYAVSQVLQNTSAERLEELESSLCLLEKDRDRGVFDSAVDKQFHYQLAELSGNKMLAQMLRKMIEAFDEYYGVFPQCTDTCLETIGQHRRLLDALRERDCTAAWAACDEIHRIDEKLIREINDANGIG
ncbi:FadR/GntR family transcriptional regulator [Luxibacter massiliensis]|uniref:FadR/GntR family transcriptional regulator n=1 Tax=Luxibacter massiliensis TaxID=2219695 RepID=UPI000F04EEC4|nr:GntR family transcriptional regulator [Luxibacter massiliensis]